MKVCDNLSRATAKRRLGFVGVDVETRDGALARLLAAVRHRTPGSWGFCNAHTVNIAADDQHFRSAVGRMTMFNDGVGVDIASRRLFGSSFPENLNGTDLTPDLLNALPDGTKVFVVGGTSEIAVKAGRALASAHPNICVAGTQHGYFSDDEDIAVARRVAESGASLVLVGMGQPRQEKWAVAQCNALSAPALCVGAFIDRAAGVVPRAPVWVRRLRAEWIFRLAREPRRLAGRYLWGNLVFLFRVEKQRRSSSSNRPEAHVF